MKKGGSEEGEEGSEGGREGGRERQTETKKENSLCFLRPPYRGQKDCLQK